MAEIIKVIKLSKIPVICICNDRQAAKVRSLVWPATASTCG
jgi:hypothetical protein